jgi:hypothetical protein
MDLLELAVAIVPSPAGLGRGSGLGGSDRHLRREAGPGLEHTAICGGLYEVSLNFRNFFR